MGRTKVNISKQSLMSAIAHCESQKKFDNRNQLACSVSEYLSDTMDTNVSHSVVTLRINEFNLEVKTPKGRRGRQPGAKLSESQKQAMQAGRKKKTHDITEVRKHFPETYSKLLDRVEKCSLRAIITAKCNECCNFNKQEIKHCTIKSCPLWNVRPNKLKE